MTDQTQAPNSSAGISINKEIVAFAKMLSNTRLLQFTLEEVAIQFPLMTAAGLIHQVQMKIGDKNGSFDHDPRVISALFIHFGELFNYRVTGDIAEMEKFAYQVGNYFAETSPYGTSGLVESLFLFQLCLAIKDLSLELGPYALTIKLAADPKKFYFFFNAYFAAILQGKESFESIWEVCKHYTLQIGIPQPGFLSSVWNNLARFIHTLVNAHKERLADIYKIARERQVDPALELLYLQLLGKILKEKVLTENELVYWLDDSQSRSIALTLLGNIVIEKEDVRQRLLDKLVGHSWYAGLEIKRLGVLLKLLESITNNDTSFRTKLIDAIRAHFFDDDKNDLSSSLQQFGQCTAEPVERYRILEDLLASGRFKQEYLKSITIFFVVHQDLALFFRFMRTAILQFGNAKLVNKQLENAIEIYREADRVAFEKAAIELCIDSEGVCRLLGHELLLTGPSVDQRVSISFDVNQLNTLQQYKLIISLLIPMHFINHTIPVIIPLLDSPSEIIKELIACKLEELIAAYQHEVIVEVSSLLPEAYGHKAQLLERLQKVWTELYNTLHKKLAVKELDPFMSNTAHMRAYQHASIEISKQLARKARLEYKGILSKVPTMQIARGGGLVQPDGTVQPMMNHRLSFTMPRTMFITPERNEYELQELFSSNWDKEFEPWEQIILSSGNI